MVHLLLAIAGASAIALARADKAIDLFMTRTPARSARLRKAFTARFAGAYSLAVFTVIIGASMIPCVGCFKFAYDMVSEMALKHDEISISRTLAERRDRIHKYYFDLIPRQYSPHAEQVSRSNIWLAANERLSDKSVSFDRYDKCGSTETLCFVYGADLPFDSKPTPQSGIRFGPKSGGLDERLERVIASAVLFFPANKLGGEMSKLEVAATDQANQGGDYAFDELEPNRFLLHWQPGSGLPEQFTVQSEYSKWRGFLWWGGGTYRTALDRT